MRNSFKRFFHKDPVVHDSAPLLGERIPLERLTLTESEIAQMNAPKPLGYQRFIEVMEVSSLLDALRSQRSIEARDQFVAFLGWKLEAGRKGRKLLFDGTGQCVSVYPANGEEKLLDDLIVLGEKRLASL